MLLIPGESLLTWRDTLHNSISLGTLAKGGIRQWKLLKLLLVLVPIFSGKTKDDGGGAHAQFLVPFMISPHLECTTRIYLNVEKNALFNNI